MNGSDKTLELRRTRHPPHPLHPSSSDAARTVTFLQALKQPRRRNLVETHQPTPYGTPAVYDLFFAGSPLWHYDSVWLPDDDLATSWGDINRLFHLARAYGLDLAQDGS